MLQVRLSAFLAITLFIVPAVWSQPLAEHLPQDAIVYIGWRGSSDLGPGYKESHLKAMIEMSQIDRMISDILPQAFERLADKVPDQDAEQLADFSSIVGRALWKHPSAFYFGGVDFSGDEPMPRIAMLCDAGDDAADVHDFLKKLIAENEDPDVPVEVAKVGSRIIVTVGNLGGDAAGALGLVQTLVAVPRLSEKKEFKAAMQNTVADPVAVAYLDSEALLKLIDSAVEREASPNENQQWQKVRDTLGLRGIQHVVYGAGFDGKQWGTRGFIAAPAPRKGLLSLMDQAPIDDALLAAIPETASTAGGFSLDVAELVDMIKGLANELEPGAEQQIDQAFGDAKRMLGFDLMHNLLKPLGSQWAFYIDENTGSSGIFGCVVVNRLRDADQFKNALGQLERMANQMMAEEMKDEDVELKFKSATVDGTELHYLGTPLVSPTWAIRDGNLYLSLQPQFAAAAAHHVSSGGKSLLDNPEFVARRKQLGAKSFGSFSFVNLRKVAPHSYSFVTAISRMFVGLADMTGVEDTPVMVVPPMHKLKPHLTASAGFSWSDDSGYYFRSLEPFPGSGVFSMGSSGAALWMMSSAMMPVAMLGVSAAGLD